MGTASAFVSRPLNRVLASTSKENIRLELSPWIVPSVVLAQEVEVADLPPPYIPVIFAFVLLGCVGILTNSLGDVISDEASLGNLSGAKAKKEMERSRSSYF